MQDLLLCLRLDVPVLPEDPPPAAAGDRAAELAEEPRPVDFGSPCCVTTRVHRVAAVPPCAASGAAPRFVQQGAHEGRHRLCLALQNPRKLFIPRWGRKALTRPHARRQRSLVPRCGAARGTFCRRDGQFHCSVSSGIPSPLPVERPHRGTSLLGVGATTARFGAVGSWAHPPASRGRPCQRCRPVVLRLRRL